MNPSEPDLSLGPLSSVARVGVSGGARDRTAPFGAGAEMQAGKRVGFRDLPWPVMFFIIAVLFPPEASFFVGAIRLSAYRVVLLISLLPCLWLLVSGRRGRLNWCDMLIAGYVFWCVLSIMMHHGLTESLESWGIHIVETLGAYMLARCCIRSSRSFIAVAAVLAIVVIVLSAVTVPECLTNRNIIRGLASGGRFRSAIDPRNGFYRAYGPFQHPILFGVFSASILGLSWYAFSHDDRIRPLRLLRAGLVVLSAITSVSSGAVAAIMSQSVIMGWDLMTKQMRRRWLLLAILLVGMYTTVDLLSNRSGMRVVLSYLTFNPGTAYGRLVIWEYGSAEVRRNPLFGIGFNQWEHPAWISDSVDNFWLLVAMRHGLPALLLLIGSVIYLLVRVGLGNPAHINQVQRKGWMVSMIGLAIAGATVAFWHQLLVFFFFMLGMTVWMLDAAREPFRLTQLPRSRLYSGHTKSCR